ncbi:MAG: hypothetical protein PVH59_00880, partial [Anaerolineae bacterium]
NITVLIVSTEADVAPPAATLPLAPGERAPTHRSRLVPALVGGVAVVALVLGLLWATGTIFGGKATETAVPTASTRVDATTPEPSPSGDMGVSPVQTGTATPTLDTTGPTATLAPTSTTQPEPTATSPSILPAVASPEPIATLPAPLLDSPAADAELQGFVTFAWTHTGSLGQDLAYQVLIWKEGADDHLGAAQSWSDMHQAINLDLVPQIMNGGSGQYLWSVVVVQRGTDERVSPEATPRRFTYPGPLGPSVPTATPSNTTLPTKIPLPATWTPAPSPTDEDTSDPGASDFPQDL